MENKWLFISLYKHAIINDAKLPTNFLLLGSLKNRSAISWFWMSFAFGITLDKRVNTFRTASDGNTSSAILPVTEDQQVMFHLTVKTNAAPI